MRKLLFIVMLIIPFISQAQKITSYKASNGVTYHPKDSVQLNKGSAYDSTFVHIWQGGFGPGGNLNMPGYYLHTKLRIKSIKKEVDKGGQRYVFNLDEGGIFGYTMDIEAAITACEVTPCTQLVNQAVVIVNQPAAVAPQPVAVTTTTQTAVATTTVTPVQPAKPSAMVADEIKKLKELLDSGAITKKEFNAQKKKLLSQ